LGGCGIMCISQFLKEIGMVEEAGKEEELKAHIYKSIDKGLAVAFLGGGLLGLAYNIYKWIPVLGVLCFLLSLGTFFLGRYLSLRFLFDEEIECGVTECGEGVTQEEMDEKEEGVNDGRL